jgi:hypothetical protein
MKNILLVFLLFFSFISFGQAGSEIYLFDMKVSDGQVVLSNGQNITHHKGYDNQPSFHPTEPYIYYSSFNDSGRSDIKYFDYEKKETKNLTLTHDREYSPLVTPDEKFISCILQRDNGVQDLVKYPIHGGKPELLIFHLKVGYHAWAGDNKLFLFVLDDSVHNSLHYYYLGKNTDTVVAENIGRSLHKIPGQNAMSFVQKISDKLSQIKKFDMTTGVINTIIATFPGQDHLTWLQNNLILTSDGTHFFVCPDKLDTSWQPVTVEGDTSMLKGITRLAVNADNTKLAVVVSE